MECVILQPVSLIADSKNTSSTLVKVCCACVNLCPSGILIIKIVKKFMQKRLHDDKVDCVHSFLRGTKFRKFAA